MEKGEISWYAKFKPGDYVARHLILGGSGPRLTRLLPFRLHRLIQRILAGSRPHVRCAVGQVLQNDHPLLLGVFKSGKAQTEDDQVGKYCT